MQQGKALISSWTFWFGLAQIALAVCGYFSGNLDGQAAMALVTTGLGSIGLRFKTSQPITGITSA